MDVQAEEPTQTEPEAANDIPIVQSSLSVAETLPIGGTLALLADAGVGISIVPMPKIGGEPPRRFLAFKWGDNPTTKGLLKLTWDGVRRLMDRFRERGVAKCFDYFHATYDPMAPGEAKKAAGQFIPEVGEEGLYFANIQWTPSAEKAIREGEWPYISPAVDHTKEGIIINLRNAGLVTDPGTINAQPTTLSAQIEPLSQWFSAATKLLADPEQSTTSKGHDMDKKRMMLDAYMALENAMRRCQGLADTDGMEKELGNKMVGCMAPCMDMARGHMQTAGMLDDMMMSGMKRDGEAKEKMMATLAAEFKEENFEKLSAMVMAKLDAKVPPPAPPSGVLLSETEAAKVSSLLVDGYPGKVPAIRRDALKSQSPVAVAAYLSAATEITPSEAPREAPPTAPTVEATAKATPNAKDSEMNKAPKTLADCDSRQKMIVEGYLSFARVAKGDKFDEKFETDVALAQLSDIDVEKTPDHRPFGENMPTVLVGGEA